MYIARHWILLPVYSCFSLENEYRIDLELCGMYVLYLPVEIALIGYFVRSALQYDQLSLGGDQKLHVHCIGGRARVQKLIVKPLEGIIQVLYILLLCKC
jgi:hypothetical protein